MLGFQGRADPCTGSEPTVLVTTDRVTGSDVVAHVCFPVWINVCCLDVTAQRECGRAAFEAAVCYSHDLSNVSEETTDSLARVRAGVATRGPLVLLHQLRHTKRLLLEHISNVFCCSLLSE